MGDECSNTKKKKPCETVSRPPLQSENTVDFVPIDNNEEDFDLVKILEEFEQKTVADPGFSQGWCQHSKRGVPG